AGIVTFFVLVFTYTDSTLDESFANLTMPYSTVIYANDENGTPQEVEKLFNDENRIWITYDKIPQVVKDAVVSIEDKRYYEHHGVDWKRTVGATVNYLIGKKDTYGGSTITQQLVKNITNDKKNDPTRKVKEILRALYIERKYNKDEILEYYLNTVTFGTSCNGIETAANYYFNNSITEADILEAVSLVGITNNPKLYDPFKNPENNKSRAKTILTEMYKNDEKITATQLDEYSKAIDTLTYANENEGTHRSSKQSYFIDQVIRDVTSDLVTEKRWSYEEAKKYVYTGGLRIYATIDSVVQAEVDKVYQDMNSFPRYPGKTQPQSAMTIVNPKNGDVVAMVGGRGEKQANGDLNRAAQSPRSPGSVIKPIAVYAPAMEDGIILPGSAIDDFPSDYLDGKLWPKNENNSYRGYTPISKAIWESTNATAMSVFKKLTPQKSFDFLKNKLGISTLIADTNKNDLGNSLGLGGLTKGITTLEMAGAYQIFANKGVFNQTRTYSKVENSEGKLIIDNAVESIQAISSASAYSVHQFMESNTLYGSARPGKLNSTASAGKTGTTSDNLDRWYMGYTPEYVGAIWFGYDLNENQILTANPCTPVFKRIMDNVNRAKKINGSQFEIPPSVQLIDNYCYYSGMAVSEACAKDPRGIRTGSEKLYYDTSKLPLKPCDKHYLVNVCGGSNAIAHQGCPVESLRQVAFLDDYRSLPMKYSWGDSQYLLPKMSANDPLYSSGSVPIYKNLLEPNWWPVSGGGLNTLCQVHACPGTPHMVNIN
ncbi:MAG: transglycosylase domain-containing protein, partial [Clostridia bacterium]